MDKMLETIKLLAMLCVVLFFGYVGGFVNFYSPFYQPAEASEPSAVTIYGRSASLLSGSDNLDCAFAGDCGYDHGWLSGDCAVYSPHPKLIPKLIKDDFYRGDDYRCSYYILDKYGEYPDVCSIYNGVNTASTNEELENAFGDGCIKTDEYYAEIFLDDVEVDYGKINFPANFDYDSESSWGSWWEDIKAKYPETKYCTVLFCYYNYTVNSIEFMVFENEQLTQNL